MIPFSFLGLGSLAVAQIYLPGWDWVGGFTVIIMQVSVQIGLNWNYQLELSLAKYLSVDRKACVDDFVSCFDCLG